MISWTKMAIVEREELAQLRETLGHKMNRLAYCTLSGASHGRNNIIREYSELNRIMGEIKKKTIACD